MGGVVARSVVCKSIRALDTNHVERVQICCLSKWPVTVSVSLGQRVLLACKSSQLCDNQLQLPVCAYVFFSLSFFLYPRTGCAMQWKVTESLSFYYYSISLGPLGFILRSDKMTLDI